MEDFKPGSATGSYGESTAYDAVDYLKKLRESLDKGTISVSEFAQKGQKAAEYAVNRYQAIAGGGSKAANSVNPIINQLRSTEGVGGFTLDANNKVRPVLPQQYQEQLRDELLPKNLTPEERSQFINMIPNDVDLFSDQGQVEREGLRQAIQMKDVAAQQKDQRSSNLKDLAGFLAKEEDRKFGLAQPDIAEEANASGMYTGTGYSDSLAREKAKLAGDTSALLAAQGLSDRDADVQSLAAVLGKKQDYQYAGLQRKFGLEDETRGFTRARDIAELSKPDMPQQSSFDKYWMPFLQAGVGGAAAYYGAKR